MAHIKNLLKLTRKLKIQKNIKTRLLFTDASSTAAKQRSSEKS